MNIDQKCNEIVEKFEGEITAAVKKLDEEQCNVVEGLMKALDDALGILKKEVAPKGRQRARDGLKYSYLDDCGKVVTKNDYRTRPDDFRFESGNYSLIEGEIEIKSDKQLAKMRILDAIAEGESGSFTPGYCVEMIDIEFMDDDGINMDHEYKASLSTWMKIKESRRSDLMLLLRD